MKYKKLCKCCGKEFETNSPQKLFCDREHYLPCPICGKLVLKTDRDFTRPPKCCSSKCTHELRKRSFKPKRCIYCGDWFIPKSGVALVCDKTHYQKCEICGKEFVRTPSTDADNITTCSPECTKEKLRIHSLKKYGTEHPMQSKEVQKKFHAAMKAKYGVEHALQIPGKVEQQQRQAYITNMEHWGVPYACFSPGCKAANLGNIISKTNLKFAERLKKYNIEFELEKVIGNRSYDFWIKGTNILVEINPTYTHNSFSNHYEKSGISKEYHRDKSENAQKHGYHCIHVFDWDNWSRIISLLTTKKRAYARNLKIKAVDPKDAYDFLDSFHLQRSCKGQTVFLGLYDQAALLELMTFGKPRYNSKHTWELLRLCSHKDYRVIGGASKLFKYATEVIGIDNIISYCDVSKFTGDVYSKIGMTLLKTTSPQEIWSKSTRYVTANLLRLRGYDQLFNTNYGKGTSNDQLMLQNGWLPVYDCGQKVFVFE